MNAGRMITEIVLATGWTVEYVMQMPARTFFAIKKHHADIKNEETYAKLINACDIQAISWGSGEYLKEIKQTYKNIYAPTGRVKKKLALRVLDADNKDDMNIVVANLKSAFDTKARLMGLPRE